MPFSKMLGICEPAQVSMMVYILLFAMYLSRNVNRMKLDSRTLQFLFGVAITSLTSVITLDVYCQTGHRTFAWVLAIMSAVGFLMVLTGWEVNKDER